MSNEDDDEKSKRKDAERDEGGTVKPTSKGKGGKGAKNSFVPEAPKSIFPDL